MRDITLKIISRQIAEDDDYSWELTTDGKMGTRNNATYIEYDSSQLLDEEDTKTIVKITEEKTVITNYRNKVPTKYPMVFSKNGDYESVYETPYGELDINYKVEKYLLDFNDEKGGKIEIEYSLNINGKIQKNHVSLIITM